MPSPNYLILDIETVPDSTQWTPPGKEPERLKLEKNPSNNDLVFLAAVLDLFASDRSRLHPLDIEKAHDIALRSKHSMTSELAQAMTSTQDPTPFAPLYAHQPIVIGCVWLDSTFKPKKVGAMKIGTGPKAEYALLKQWNDFMDQQKPTVVTWYGRGFDLPVLMLRSFKCGIPMEWYFSDKDYRYRYSDRCNADLCDIMSDFGAIRGLKLDSVAKLIGLPGKHGDGEGGEPIDGSQVAEMYAAGKLEEIASYCISDAVQTAFIFLRWLLIKARLPLETYQDAARELLKVISTLPETAKSLAPQIDEDALLLYSPGP